MASGSLGLLLYFGAAAAGSEPALLDVAELAKSGHPEDIADDRLRAAVGAGEKLRTSFAPALALEGGKHALAWTECDMKSCRSLVGVLGPKVGGTPLDDLKIVKKVVLPGPPKIFMVDGAKVEDVALYDIDGDGQAELLIHYQASEPPRPALGSLVHEYIAIYNLPDLSSAWQFEIHRSGGGSEPVCDWDVKRVAASGSAAQPVSARLMVDGGCQPPTLPGTPAKPKASKSQKTFGWQKQGDHFLPTPH